MTFFLYDCVTSFFLSDYATFIFYDQYFVALNQISMAVNFRRDVPFFFFFLIFYELNEFMHSFASRSALVL